MKTFITILFIFTLAQAGAQKLCGSSAYTKQLLLKNPALQNSFDQAEQQIVNTIAKTKRYAARDTSANEIINIPVVIHVIYKSAAENINDDQILSQMVSLNNDYSYSNVDKVNAPQVFKNVAANIRIQFCLAQVDPKGKRTSGIIRKQTGNDIFAADDAMKFSAQGGDDAWDSQHYLNIWICALSNRTLGYATMPGGEADKDGVVIAYDVFGTVGTLRPPFDKGRTATHEIGHWLGLKHTWGDADCGDDGVDDTPRQKTYNFGCPSFPHTTDCSQDSNGDMFMNYMDFSDDGCMNMFTQGQKARMRALFAKGNLRNSFLTSFACDSSLAQPASAATTDSIPVVTNNVADQYKFYPNPVQNSLVIEYTSLTEIGVKTYGIYNAIGVKVLSGEISKGKSIVNLAALSSGIYVIRIVDGTKHYSSKIIKL